MPLLPALPAGWRFRSLQTRLTASFVAVIAATALALGLSLTLLFAQVLHDQYAITNGNKDQNARAILVGSIAGQVLAEYARSGQLQKTVALLSKQFQFRIQVYLTSPGYAGTLVADSGPERPNPAQHLALDSFPSYQKPLVIVPGYGTIAQLRISEALTDRAYRQQQFVETVLWIGLGACLLALVAGGMLGERLTAPLRVLTRATSRMGAGNLGERVPEDRRDEAGELAHQFNQMAARLQESFATISADRDRLRQFVADVSHELRTPLTALRTFNDLLRDGAGEDAVTRGDFLSESARQIERLDWLTHNLLDLSRLDAGITRLAPRHADLAETLRRAVETNRPIAEAKQITLHCEAHPVFIAHDPPRLEQALSNIIGNAVKFSPRGGNVWARAEATAEGAAAEVSDEGPGIPPEEAAHIFERFYRGRAANRAGEGSGLGLAIARSVVEAHGGLIAAQSRPGHGATIRLTLPATPLASATPRATPAPDVERH